MDIPKENLREFSNESSDSFKVLIDSLPHFIWESEPNGTYSYVNQQFLDWSALSLEQIKNNELSTLIHPDDVGFVEKTWQEALVKKAAFTCEYRMKDPQGKYVWFLGKTVPVKNAEEQIIKWVGTTTNINEQKLIEDAQKESERQFRQLADLMPQHVWTANERGDLTYVNLKTLQYFGKSEEEIIQMGWQSLIHPDDIEIVLATWQKSLKNLTPYQVEYRLKNKENLYRWHLGRATAFLNNNNEVKWFGTNTDIETHKANEQKKDDFISMASHELKTPVTNLKGLSYILNSWFENEKNSQVAQLVKKMDVQVDKLTKLIGDFLSVSKVKGQHFQLEKQKFKFNDLVEECVSGIQLATPTHRLVIENNEEINYYGDRLRLEQVFSNFISNAIKYSPDADKVVIRSEVVSENITVSIQDFGIGIKKENIDKLFSRFYRVDNNSTRFQGLGLGLYISSEIIKAHHGDVKIESEPGKGSTFYFLLPLKKSDQPVMETNNESFITINK